MKIEGSENSEEKFKNFWRHRATRWLEEIDASLIDPVSKKIIKF